VGTLMVEVRLAEEHVNRQLATEGIITQTAIASVLSKEGGKAFKQLIKGLTDGSE
jgi:hypothetical protein